MSKQSCYSRTVEHVTRCLLDQRCCDESRSLTAHDIIHIQLLEMNYVQLNCGYFSFSFFSFLLYRSQNSSSPRRTVSLTTVKSVTFTAMAPSGMKGLASRLTVKPAFCLCENVKDCQWWMPWQIPAQLRTQSLYCTAV